MAGIRRDFARVLPAALLPTRVSLFGLVALEETKRMYFGNAKQFHTSIFKSIYFNMSPYKVNFH